ncbi:MAG: 50S ribosomal protein L10, partial [Alphaproteobacteria bacterium MarineAlpha8_Bin1]
MLKAEKQNFVKEFNSVLKDKNFLVVAHYKGLTVSEISDLRNQIREKNAVFKVAKNTLARRAIKETNFEKLDKFFVGPTSVAFSDDPVGTSKVMINYSKENENLKVIGGVMGDKELTIDEIKKLASLPSMDALRSQILGLLASVQTRIVYSLKDSQS